MEVFIRSKIPWRMLKLMEGKFLQYFGQGFVSRRVPVYGLIH